MYKFYLGARITMRATNFKDINGEPVTPTSAQFTVIPPDGIETDVATASAPGAWTASVDATQAGIWRVRMVALSTGRPFVRETVFKVESYGFSG